MTRLALLAFTSLGVFSGATFAQTPEQTARAEAFFTTYDTNKDQALSKPEFVDGFITQARIDQPTQANIALALWGRKRIENCLGLAFERADTNTDGLMVMAELSDAYRRDAFSGLREIC